MYILKLTNEEGFSYLIESRYPDRVTGRSLKHLKVSNLSNFKIKVVKKIDDLAFNIGLIKFNIILNEVNRTHKFKFLNGRFRIDKYLFDQKMAYVVVYYCKKSMKYYVFLSRNPVTALYRAFRNNKFIKSMKKDVNRYGLKSISVSVYGPFNDENISCEARAVFKQLGFSGSEKKLRNDLKKLYFKTIYLRLFNLSERYRGARPEKNYLHAKVLDENFLRLT